MKRTLLLGLVPVVALSACMRRTAPRTGPEAGSPVARASDAYPLLAPPRPETGNASGPADDGVPPAPMPTPTPPPTPPAPDLIGDAKKAAQIEEEQRKILIEEDLKLARAALQNAQIDDARVYFGKVLELDPTNVEANQQWKNLSAERPSTTSDYFTRMQREEAVKRDEAQAEVSGHLKRGHAMESSEDFAGAIREYQAALAIVAWYADPSGFGVTADSLKDLIDNTKRKADRLKRAQIAEASNKAKEMHLRDLKREREERLARIHAFFKEADLAFRRGEWDSARQYAELVLREDPENCSAKRLIELSHEAEHSQNMTDNTQKFSEEWKNVFEQMEIDILPQVKTVVFPDNWLTDIANRRPRVVGDVATSGDSESKQAIYTALEAKRVKGLQFTDQNLDQVVTYLRTVTGLNFHITPTVRSTLFDNVKVNIAGLDDVTVRQVLDIIAGSYALKWEPRNGVVTIAAPGEIAGTMRLQYFDVKDLAVKIQNFRGTDIYLAPSNYTPPEPPELPEAKEIYQMDTLVNTIKEVVDSDQWGDGTSIDLKAGTLIVRNTSEVLGHVGELLEELRRNSGPLVSMEVRFITVEDNFLRDVGVDMRGLGDNAQGIGVPGLGANAPQDDVFFGTPANPQGGALGVKPEPASVGTSNSSGLFYNDGQDGGYRARVENLFDSVLGNPNTLLGTGGMSLQHTFLDDIQMEVILRAVQKSERVQQITASKITVYNTQRATVEVLNKVAYVADYDVEIAQASNIANPIIKNAIDGVVLDVKPVVSANRRFITLELRPTVAVLTRPIPTFSTSLASGPVTASAPVVIQIPRLQKSSVRTTVTMPDGGTLLLGGLKFYEQVDATSEVPILGKIPVLGFLFSRKGHYVNRRNLVVLITANVVALEESEPRGDYHPPMRPEATIEPEECPVEDTCDVMSAAPCAPPPCAPPPCAPPPCSPCGGRR
jgi:Flp pilus assembly secretin CpaC/tetratricopeptide (TPR) repeat protein